MIKINQNVRKNITKAKAIEAQNKKRLLAIDPNLNDDSGIYFFTRTDEDGFRYAYIGQAVHILSRLAQHLVGYQHIDLSIKKHGLYSEENLYGWKIKFMNLKKAELDDAEQHFIKLYASHGYQLRNKTSGSQGEGKKQIDEYRPAKGYRDGLEQGRKNLARELSHIIDKHLTVEIKPGKTGNKVSQKAFEKFRELLEEHKTEGKE